jgi:SulP family sulfate permease
MGSPLYIMLGLVLMTIAIVLLFKKLFQLLCYCRLVVLGLGIETKTVADIASISGGFPPFIFRIFL